MLSLEVVRAWKDPDFRATLGAARPEHPAGEIELTDPGLKGAIEAGPNLKTHTGRCHVTHKPCGL